MYLYILPSLKLSPLFVHDKRKGQLKAKRQGQELRKRQQCYEIDTKSAAFSTASFWKRGKVLPNLPHLQLGTGNLLTEEGEEKAL